MTAGSVDAINTPSAYSTGAFPANTTVIELGGSPVGNPATQGAGTLTRDFLIPCDSTVNFSFDWSNPSTHNATATLTRGSDLIPPFTLIAEGVGVQNLHQVLFTFAVSAGTVTATFAGTGSDNSGAIIHNVVLTAS